MENNINLQYLGDSPTPKPMVPKPPPPQPPTEAEQKLEKLFDIAASKMTRSASRIQKNRLVCMNQSD